MMKPSRKRIRLALTRQSLRNLTAPELTVPNGRAWEEETKRACTETCYECTIGTDPN
jgi:hypothetical protein